MYTDLWHQASLYERAVNVEETPEGHFVLGESSSGSSSSRGSNISMSLA